MAGNIVCKDTALFNLCFKMTLTLISLDFFHYNHIKLLVCKFQPTVICTIGNGIRVFLASQFTRKSLSNNTVQWLCKRLSYTLVRCFSGMLTYVSPSRYCSLKISDENILILFYDVAQNA